MSVSLGDSYAGTVQFSHNGTLNAISVQGWNMNAAEVVCRELGFKAAIAPFSTIGRVRLLTRMCIQWINCTGHEPALSFCSLKFTIECIGNAKVNATVTCDPSKYFYRLLVIGLFLRLRRKGLYRERDCKKALQIDFESKTDYKQSSRSALWTFSRILPVH